MGRGSNGDFSSVPDEWSLFHVSMIHSKKQRCNLAYFEKVTTNNHPIGLVGPEDIVITYKYVPTLIARADTILLANTQSN